MSTIGSRAQQVKSVPSIGVPFVPIPHEIAQRRDISSLSKLVFSVIANHARMRRDDSSPMTNAQIADAVGATVSAVRRSLDELEKAGLIDRRYGASERVRESVAITYTPGRVARPCATPAAPAARLAQPGCPPASHGVARPCATPLNTKNEERSENALAPTLGGGGGERRPSPSEIAESFRLMVAGRWSPQMFEGRTTAAPSAPPRSPVEPATAAPPVRTSGEPSPASSRPGSPSAPSVRSMAYGVGYSAVAAAGFVRADKRPPLPRPRDGAELARMRAARAESLRIPHTVGGMANLGKM